jgi:hypothetical protein
MANEEQQQPDTSEPSEERKANLEAAYEQQKYTDAPYKDVRIYTLGELQWILSQRQWSVEHRLPEGMQWANLSGANLTEADLNRADLSFANLSGARLSGANLSGAHLIEANLSRAYLEGVNLNGADLTGAKLRGASLDLANLRGADLVHSFMDAETTLDFAAFDIHTKVFGVRWNGVRLDVIDWPSSLGDEPDPKLKRAARVFTCLLAVRAYHALSVELREQGLTQDASKYRLRELAMERILLWNRFNLGGWLLNVLLGAVAGNGEKPGRAFIAYLSIVGMFAAIYWGVTNFLHTSTPHLQWYEAIVLSLTSFHGRGFFPGTIQLGDPLAIVAALEAVSGLFIELLISAKKAKCAPLAA